MVSEELSIYPIMVNKLWVGMFTNYVLIYLNSKFEVTCKNKDFDTGKSKLFSKKKV